MVVDYSKWEKLELSDDSDIEVHPNVDKKSFIRWKQRDIHEKREQAKLRMLQLEVNIETNEDLLKRVNKLIEAGENGRKIGSDVEADVKFTQEGETKEKPAKATSPEQPKYADMMESMLVQIVAEGGDHFTVLNKLKEHRDMITQALKDEGKELENLKEEKKKHITAEDIRTGWDSTIVYKPNKEPASTEAAKGSSTTTASAGQPSSGSETTIEVLNSPSSSRPQPKVNEDGLEEVLPATEEFGKVPKGDMEAAFKYLMQHQYIVTENQKDALLMSAFEHELEGDTKRAEQVVWNSLLIQYSATLGKDGIRLFFSKVVDRKHPARAAFEEDVERTYNHIKQRCKILRENYAKEADEEEATIQLHPADENTELIINVPEPGSEGYEVYESFSEDMKKAIQTRKLDEINKALEKLSVKDAEDMIGMFNEAGVLSIANKIYEPNEWEQKKAELAHEDTQAEHHQTEDPEPVTSSIDEVD